MPHATPLSHSTRTSNVSGDILCDETQHTPSVVISSCGRYSQVLSKVLSRLAELSITRVHVVSDDRLDSAHAEVVKLLHISDQGWSSNLLSLLAAIDDPFVFLWVDDLYPIDIKPRQLCDALTAMRDENLDILQLCGTGIEYANYWKRKVGNTAYADLPSCSPYRITSVGALWRKSFLTSVLRASESAWEFEINGNRRALGKGRARAALTNRIDYINIMIKGAVTEKGEAVMNGLEMTAHESDRLTKNKFLSFVSGLSPCLAAHIQPVYWNYRHIWRS